MNKPTRQNLKMYQGSTFTQVFRWESALKDYKVITGITKAAPCVVTSAAHGIPKGWRVKVSNVVGMKEINSDTEYKIITDTSTDEITFGYVNASGYTTYTSGGTIEYNTPVSLSGVTARMQIRSKVTSDTVIAEYTTTDGTIVVDNTFKTITIAVPAATTELYTFKTAVYSMELINGLEVIPFIYGNIVLDTEITR